MNIDSIVRTTELSPGYPVLEIEHPSCSARVALNGAHVMSWYPEGGTEVLYMSPDAVFREGKAIRGGIPICWPWFNAHPTNPDLPSHGVARNQFWRLDGQTADADGVTVKLSLAHEDWKVAVTIRLGNVLEVSLESTNRGAEVLPISGALHTYLRVGDVGKVQVRGLEDMAYLDTMGERVMRRQEGPISFDREVDRIYEASGSAVLEDAELERTIVVEKEGSPSTVVWNPWVEKAAALGDLPDRGFEDFVCIEAAIANERAIMVDPGGSHRISTRISVA